ncbi:MAG: hypothetical protein QM493_11735 [Sulfurovum sp.]
MAKRKKFQKKQFISMFESGNYQKVISKAKQFEINGMEEEELKTILTISYTKLADSYFLSGDITRALRDINSLLKTDDSDSIKLIKLKYLCYMEHFTDAIELAQELIVIKDAKIKKEAIFFYLMANIYSGDYALNEKLLKSLSVAKQRYILGFNELVQGDITLALKFWEKSNPKIKIEKENLKALISIIKSEDINVSQDIKPLYHFLLNGDSSSLANTKNSRLIKTELNKEFKSSEKSGAIKNLLELKSPIDTDIIIKNIDDKSHRNILIYNNIVLLVEDDKYSKALEVFIKNRDNLIYFIESASLFIEMKMGVEDRKSDKIVIPFFSKYLKLHHKKIAPFQIEYILLFLLREDRDNSFKLAKEYNIDNILFLIQDLPLLIRVEDTHHERFNTILKKYNSTTNSILDNITNSLKEDDKHTFNIPFNEEIAFVKHISIYITLIKNLKNPHRRYKSSIFKILDMLALSIQTFSYARQMETYKLLSNTIEYHIDYFKFSRVDLSLDIKALFVSIAREKSIKRDDIYDEDEDEDEDNFMAMAMRIFYKEDLEEEKSKYNFDEAEYDLALIQTEVIKALERGDTNPFAPLFNIHKEYSYHKHITEFIIDLYIKIIKLKIYDTNTTLSHIMNNLKIRLYDQSLRDSVISTFKTYAIENAEQSIEILNYFVTTVPSSNRESVWYLKWVDGYISIVVQHKLKRDKIFKHYLGYFIQIQEKKIFKSLNKLYIKNMKIAKEQKGGLVD